MLGIESTTGAIVAICGAATALLGAVGVAFDQWAKARKARTEAKQAEILATSAQIEAERLAKDQAQRLAQEKTKFEEHLIAELERTRVKAAEDLRVERQYSKDLLEQLSAEKSHTVDCNERLRALETGDRKKDEILAAQTMIINRLDHQVQSLLKAGPLGA